MREFESGATRDDDIDKLDYEGFESPLVMRRFAQYMHQHRTQKDNKQRDSDNWQKGLPLDALMKSLLRHVIDAWGIHRGVWITGTEGESMEELLCAIRFNANGYLYGIVKGPTVQVKPPVQATPKHDCRTCPHGSKSIIIPPCQGCFGMAARPHWEPTTCLNCNARCCGNCCSQDNWEPKTDA